MMFATLTGGEGRRPGEKPKNWHRCLVEDLRLFRATEGSTELCPLVFGVETVVWTIAAKKSGTWYQGVLHAADRFMVTWHKDETDMSKTRDASGVGGAQGNGNGKGGGNIRKETAVDESRKEAADRAARYQAE